MAQGQIKKGFFFYFGLFVLLLLAVFLICIVIMIFNPGTTILWMQYFTSNGQIALVETTDNKTPIDLTTLTDLEIVCDAYTSVSVVRDNSGKDMAKDAIFLANNAKGFVTASEAKPFSYSVTFVDDKKLKIEIHEQKGFLYFSKDIKIIVHATTHNNSLYDFKDLNLKVTTGDGNIYIGGGINDVESKLASITATTTGGSVYFQKRMDTSSLKKIDITTDSGNISSTNEVEFTNKSHDFECSGYGLKVDCDLRFKTKSGRVTFGILDAGTNNLTFECESSNLNIKCINQYVFGDLKYDFSTNNILSPNIMIDNVYGNFSASLTDEKESEPEITIKKVEGNLSVFCRKGKVVVGEIGGAVDIEKGETLSVDITIAGENQNNIIVNTKSGEVRVKFLDKVSPNVKITTNTGRVYFRVNSSAKFIATLYIYSEINSSPQLQTDLKKMVVHLGNYDLKETRENQLVVNNATSSDGKITVTTNAITQFDVG